MSNSIDQLAEGGRGIKLMWQIADELNYTRTLDGRNCLSLSKSYEVEDRNRSQNIKKDTVLDGLMKFLKSWDWQDDLNDLTKVLEWFEQLQDLSIPHEVWFQFQLALAEGFTNAVRHAHKNLPTATSIQLEITVFNGCWEFKVWDCGPYFDFDAKLKEIIAADRKKCLNLEVLNDDCLMASTAKTLERYQFLIAR
jgi:serine/threonine-protein kinase RsbW